MCIASMGLSVFTLLNVYSPVPEAAANPQSLVIRTVESSTGNTVEFTRIAIVDDDGNERMVLTASPDPVIMMYDNNDRYRLGLGVQRNTPRILLKDPDGHIFWEAI